MKMYTDHHMAYEHLGRNVFRCLSKGCDPFGAASADRAWGYFCGSLQGKKDMSAIISRLIFEAERGQKKQHIGALRELYDKVWEMEDHSGSREYSIQEGTDIMNMVGEIAEDVMDKKNVFDY